MGTKLELIPTQEVSPCKYKTNLFFLVSTSRVALHYREHRKHQTDI
jgi:hypothetical protein